MKVKHLDELYSWKQIRKFQLVRDFNPHNGFVPVALYAPGGGHESHFGGGDDRYEWYGKQSPYYAKILWETVRERLSGTVADSLAFDVVEASECFNTIRFKDPDKARAYCVEFKRLLKALADSGEIKCAIGRVSGRRYPWDPLEPYAEIVIADDAEYKPYRSHDPKFDNSIADYRELPPLSWAAVEKYFIVLTPDELAFLNGENIINKSPTAVDKELIDACAKLDVGKVRKLLEAGANPNATSGNPYAESIITCVIDGFCDREYAEKDVEDRISDVYRIMDLLIEHGCDIDFSPYDEGAPLYIASYQRTEFVKYLLDKGGDPNAISWIGTADRPATALDSVADDINAYGADPDLEERFDMISKRGGKYFSELVPDFYDV